jgi:hypothetical protein
MKKSLVFVLGVIFFALMPLFTACEGFCPDGPDDPNPGEVTMDSLLIEVRISNTAPEVVLYDFLFLMSNGIMDKQGPKDGIYIATAVFEVAQKTYHLKYKDTKARIDSAIAMPTVFAAFVEGDIPATRTTVGYANIHDTTYLHRGNNIIDLSFVETSRYDYSY